MTEAADAGAATTPPTGGSAGLAVPSGGVRPAMSGRYAPWMLAFQSFDS